MLLPVRCFTCNRVLANMQQAVEAHKDRDNYSSLFERLGLRRSCCQKIVMTHVEAFAPHPDRLPATVAVQKDLDVRRIVYGR